MTGEVFFGDGLCITPHCAVGPLLTLSTLKADGATTRALSRLTGWKQHALGVHLADHGSFEVEVTTGGKDRVFAVFPSHAHSFYDANTVGDSERRSYHEMVIMKDLRGQREFGWGDALCRYDPRTNHDWLVVSYNRGALVPQQVKEALRRLLVHEREPVDDSCFGDDQ